MTLAAIKKLKERIRELERKDAQSRKRLQSAMLHANKLAKSYQTRLKSAIHEVKLKHAFESALACARAACKAVKMDKDTIMKVVQGLGKKTRKTIKKSQRKKS